MIKYCVDKWNENKDELERDIADDEHMNEYGYKELVKKVVRTILNRGHGDFTWDADNIAEIDNGDYQGTLLYLIPTDSYQPMEYDYLMTYIGYGSCSVCDTLLGIHDSAWRVEKPTQQQVKEYMALCKDIICNMIRPYNTGWRASDDFEPVKMVDYEENTDAV